MLESALIARYFTHPNSRSDVVLGVGDDAALLQVPSGHELVAAVDTIIEGVHFAQRTAPEDIGYRALAVNLSDLAAMGASPAWYTLALSMPQANEAWIEAFAGGLRSLADEHRCALVGGDTVQGPLVVTVQVLGLVESGTALRRSGACVGDEIYVTAMTGEAAAGLTLIQTDAASDPRTVHLRQRFLRPTPRVTTGRKLRQFASSAMDISDGLLIDLQRLCAASSVGAEVDIATTVLSQRVRERFGDQAALQFALSGGDDYELLYTAGAEHRYIASQHGVRIGRIVAGGGIECRVDGQPYHPSLTGYEHFRR